MAANTYKRDCQEVVRRLNARIIPVQKLKHAEFAIQFDIQFVTDLPSSKKNLDKLKKELAAKAKKNPAKSTEHLEKSIKDLEKSIEEKEEKKERYDLDMFDLSCAVCALINTSGGIILIKFKSSNPQLLENWKGSVRDALLLFTGEDLYTSSVKQEHISDEILEIHVSRGNRLVPVHTNFHIRDGCSSTELRQFVPVKQALKNEKEYQYDSTPEKWTNFNYGQDAKEQNESSTLEYKHYHECADVRILLEKVTTGKSGSSLQKTLFAFVNQKGGGILIIGIDDDSGKIGKSGTGRKCVYGQKLSLNEQEEFRNEFGIFMRRGMHGEARIWRDKDYKPTEGKEWTMNFIPVKNTPNNESRYLIHIHVNHFPGGVYASMPEMYTVLSDGTFTCVDYDKWKKCITSTEDEHQKYIHDIPDSPTQSTSDQQSGNADNQVTPLDGVEEYLPELADELKEWTGKHQIEEPSVSWNKHSGIWEKDRQIGEGISDVPKISELCTAEVLTPRTPISYFPPEKFLLKSDVDGAIREALQYINKYYQAKPAVAFAGTSLISLFPQIDGINIPSNHVRDIFVLSKDGTDSCGIDVWSIYRDAQVSDTHSNYLKSLLRQLKRLLLIRSISMTVTMKGFVKVRGQADHSCITTLSPAGDGSLELLQKAIASILLPGIQLKNRFGEEYLVHLTKDQIKTISPAAEAKLSIIDGPPGSGKTLMAFTLIENLKKEKNLKKNQIKYVCPSQALANYADYQDLCLVGVSTGKNLIEMIKKDINSGVCIFVFDDGHWIHCGPKEWPELYDTVNKTRGIQVVIFQDTSFQNYGHQNIEMIDALEEYREKHPHFHYYQYRAPPKMLRNSLTIFSFFKANAGDAGEQLEWRHNIQGHDVCINSHKHSDLVKQCSDNPIIKIVNDLLNNDDHGYFYRERDIVILVGSFILRRRDFIKSIENALKEVHGINVQRASEVPAKLMVLDSLRNFVGLDSKCCIVIIDEESINDTKLRLFTVSRGIMHVQFVLTYDEEDKRDTHQLNQHSVMEKMYISQKDMWKKKSMELVHHFHRQLCHGGEMKDKQELSLQWMIPETPQWEAFVLRLIKKQLDDNKEKQRSNKQIQECIKMMIPAAWHMVLYEHQAHYLVYGQSEGDSADKDVLGSPAQYPEHFNELIDLTCGVISTCQSADALKMAVKVILDCLRILTKSPADPMNTVSAVENQATSVTPQEVYALEALDTAMKNSEMITVAMQQGVIDVLLGALKQLDKDDRVKQQVLQALGTVMKDHNARSQAIDQGLVKDLLNILELQDLDIKEFSEGDRQTQSESSDGEPAAKRVKLDKDQVLRSLITSPVKRRAIDVLCKLKEESTFGTVATDRTVVDGVMDFLRQNGTDNLEDALEVLHTLMENSSMRTLIIQKGVEGVLLGSIKQPNIPISVKLDLLYVLCRVNGEKTDRTKESDQAVVDCLLDTMRQLITDYQVKGDAMERLQGMMKDNNMMTGVIQQRVFDILLEITKISQKDPTVREAALQVVDTVKRYRTLRTEEIDQVAVDGVLKLIRQHEDDKQGQLDALGVLNTTLQNSDMRTAEILPGVIKLLLDVITQPKKDDAVKKQVLQVLHNVKENSPFWTEKIDRGVIDGLLGCMRQHKNNNQVQRDDIRILDKVMKESNKMRTLAIQQGAVDSLLGMITQPETGNSVKLIVLQVLQTAKKESTALTENIDQAVVDSFLDILNQHNSSNVLVQEETMEVIHTAMEDCNMRTEAVQRGLVNQLLDILKLSGYVDTVKLKLIEVLHLVKEGITTTTEAICHGMVDGLLDILKEYDTDRWMQEDAIGVLDTVIKDSNVLPPVLMQEVSRVLLGIVKDTARAAEIRGKALRVVNTAMQYSCMRPALLQQGVVDVLLGIITHGDKDTWVQIESQRMIDTWMRESDMRSSLLQQGVVDVLLGIFTHRDRGATVQGKTLKVIDTWMMESDIRSALLQQGVVNVLLAIIKQKDIHVTVQVEAQRMIDAWMKDSDTRSALLQQGVVDVLLGIFTHRNRGSIVQVKALKIINTSMEYSEMRIALSQQGVVNVLLGIISQGDIQVRVQVEVLGVFNTMMNYSDMKPALLQQGVVDVLLRIMTHGNKDYWIQLKTLEVIETAIKESDMRTAFLQQRMVDVLLQIITHGDRNVSVKVNALKVLCTVNEYSPARPTEMDRVVINSLLDILRLTISENEFEVIRKAADIMYKLASANVITYSTILPMESCLQKFIQDNQNNSDAWEAITSIESLISSVSTQDLD